MTALWVALGAAVGAPLRYLIDRALQARLQGRFPWGTFAVNVLGSLVVGVLAGAAAELPAVAGPALGIGFCGALTTYSTFSYETLRLLERRESLVGTVNVVGSVLACVAAAALGWLAVAAVLA
jgi:CrcB protein